jgi:hypothetical protein
MEIRWTGVRLIQSLSKANPATCENPLMLGLPAELKSKKIKGQ